MLRSGVLRDMHESYVFRRAARSSSRALVAFLAAAALFVSFPGHAVAQSASDSATAQALFDEGKRLMTAGRYADACPKLEESQRLDGGSGTLVNLASCYEHLGRLASAWTTYLEAATQAHAAGNGEREAAARDFAKALAPRLSRLEIRVPEEARLAGLEIKRDGALVGSAQWGVPLPLDPGEHVIAATAPGRAPWQERVKTGAPGSTVSVNVPKLHEEAAAPGAAPVAAAAAAPTVTEQPPAPASASASSSSWPAQRTFALVAGGIGLAGVVVGAVFGLQSMSYHDEAEKLCGPTTCPTQDGVDKSDDARRAGTWSTVGFIVGGAGLAAGSVLWLTAPTGPHHEQARVRLGVGPFGLRVMGSY